MGLFGGSKQKIPATGFHSQPPQYQQTYSKLINDLRANIMGIDTEMFTPQLSEGGQAAYDKILAGFTPTEESLQADLAMLQNPFDEYVINNINREATGQNSLVNQANMQAGQQGSNRSFLANSDVEQNRLNNIGVFRQNQYNNAINQVLSGLAPMRASDAMNAYTTDLNFNTATQMAPYNAMLARWGLFNQVPTSFGTFGTPEQTVKTGGGLGGVLGGIGSIASLATGNPAFGIAGNVLSGGGISPQSIAGAGLNLFGGGGGFFGNSLGQTIGSIFSKSPTGPYLPYGISDRRLKFDIEYVGEEKGHKLYKYRYNFNPEKQFIGVMADEVEKIMPEAVKEIDGYKAVNYPMIGLELKEVA